MRVVVVVVGIVVVVVDSVVLGLFLATVGEGAWVLSVDPPEVVVGAWVVVVGAGVLPFIMKTTVT